MLRRKVPAAAAACAVMLSAAGFGVLSRGINGASPGAAAPEVVSIGQSQCVASLVATGLDLAGAGVTCVSLSETSKLLTIAGFASQTDGEDTIVLDPSLPDDPGTVEPENRVDIPCTGDTNGDSVVCGRGDQGVDDALEVAYLVDLRDDGLLDGKYRLRASDFASMDVEANQLHEEDGVLWILYFTDVDEPMQFSTSKGKLDFLGSPTGVFIATCGSSGGVDMFFDEDCDGDAIPGDGVASLRLTPSTPAPSRGAGEVTVSSPAGSTLHGFVVVGEQASIDVSILKQPASTGATTGDCLFESSSASLASAMANPRVAVLLVRSFDSDGTAIASTLHDWSADDAAKAILWAPQTFTRDLSAFGLSGVGFIQLVCGNALSGIVEVTAMTSETISLDPAAGQAQDSARVQIAQDPAMPSPTPSHTPVTPSQNTLAIDANITNGGGPCMTVDQTGITAVGQKHRVAVCLVNFGSEPVGAFSYSLPQGGDAFLESIELPPNGAGVDDNPDANTGATTFSDPSLGDRWICVGIGGLQPNGTYSGPCSRTDDPATLVSGPLGVVTFRARRGGAGVLGIGPANMVDASFDEMGSCNPVVEVPIACVGATVQVLTLPTASPTPTSTTTPTNTPTFTHTPTASATATSTPSPTWTSTSVPTSTEVACEADVTGDGRVTVRDVLFVARGLPRQDLRADVNGDGRVSVADLKLVVRSLVRGRC